MSAPDTEEHHIETPPEGMLLIQALHRIPMSNLDWVAVAHPASEKDRQDLYHRIYRPGENELVYFRRGLPYRKARIFFDSADKSDKDIDTSFKWDIKAPQKVGAT